MAPTCAESSEEDPCPKVWAVRVGGDDGELRPRHYICEGREDDGELRPRHYICEGREDDGELRPWHYIYVDSIESAQTRFTSVDPSPARFDKLLGPGPGWARFWGKGLQGWAI